jgi:transposase
MRHLSENEVAQVIALIEDGKSQRYVAHRFNVSRSVVARAWARYQETGRCQRRRGQGRRRVTSIREDRNIANTALRERTVTAHDIRTNLFPNRSISDQTIRNRLREADLRSRNRARVPMLTVNHRRFRLEYARAHVDWTQRQWSRVLFTDESRFCLFNNDKRIRVWRRRGERFDRACVAPVRAFNGGSVMVWAGITTTQRTNLVVIPPPGMTAVRYINEILRPHVLPFRERIGDQFILMHDNARPHTAALTREFLQNRDITVLDHPAISPDLNPIEHIWDLMGRELRHRPRQPTTLAKLERVLQEIWQEIPQIEISRCINMRDRLIEVIYQRGGSTSF